MRIISGLLKGKIINFIKNSNTRPLKDSVKENIFNILKHSNLINIEIEKANILDLYSGIGSFGLECISRGAEKVTFVEESIDAVNILKKNLNLLLINNKATIINEKIEDMLKNNKKEKFNIFFLDPPFADNEFIKVLNMIQKNKIYKSRHIVVLHREKETIDKLDNFIDIILTKKYGRSKVIFGVFK
jgi:16S rRNA (guanine966-N2)-methyltransferase